MIKWGESYSDHIGIYTSDVVDLTSTSQWVLRSELTGLAGGNTMAALAPVNARWVIVYLVHGSAHPASNASIKTLSVYGEDY